MRINPPAPRPSSVMGSSALSGIEPAPAKLVEAMRAHGRTVEIAQPGSEELRYLDYMGAEANVGGPKLTDILLRARPARVAVLEEFLHGTQSRLGVLDARGRQAAEVEVKDFMIRHRRLLGIGAPDAANLGRLLVEERRLLEQGVR